jgi:hypothetical protein
VDGVRYCQVNYNANATNIVLGDDILKQAYVVYDYYNMEISIAKSVADGGEDDIHEIVRDVPGASPAMDVPMSLLGYDQSAMAEPTTKPEGVPFITVTSPKLTTATAFSDSMGTDSTVTTSSSADGGKEDKDNAVTGKKSGHTVYLLVSALFIPVLCVVKDKVRAEIPDQLQRYHCGLFATTCKIKNEKQRGRGFLT